MTDIEPQSASAGCEYCETRELCRCPEGPEICAVGGKCPCDPAVCPCPPKTKRPPEPPYDHCPAPWLCGPRGLVLSTGVIAAMITGVLVSWTTTPFAAIGMLLLIVPVTLVLVLVLAALGRWGRRATGRFAFLPWLWVPFWLLGGALSVFGAIALLGGQEKLASIPLFVVGLLFGLAGWRRHTIVACRLMPWLVILALSGVLLAAGGFGIGALVRGDEPYAGVGLLGIALWLGLIVVSPWWITCRSGSRYGRIVPGLRLLFLMSVPVLIGGAVLLAIHGLPRPDADTPAVVAVEEVEAVDDTSEETTSPPPTDDDETVVTDPEPEEQEEQAQEEQAQEEQPQEEQPQEEVVDPVPPELLNLGETLGVPGDSVESLWRDRMGRTPAWTSEGEMPAVLGPDFVGYNGTLVGPYVVILMEFASPLVDTGILGAGSQLVVRVAFDPAPADESATDQLRTLMPGGSLESFNPKRDFEPITDGDGATAGRFAVFVIPVPATDVYFQLEHFYRYTIGDVATDDDPTATDTDGTLTLTDGRLESIGIVIQW